MLVEIKELNGTQLTVFLLSEHMMRISPNVNRVHEVRVNRMNECVEHEHRRPIDERRNWLQFLEFGAFLVEWHRHVEQNVEEHCHRQEHRIHFQIAFADLRLVSIQPKEIAKQL